MSKMSPAQQAELVHLVEQEGDAGLRRQVLGALGWGASAPPRPGRDVPRDLPPQWTQIHVLDRLEEAFAVLTSLPARTRPKQFGNGMPTPVQERPSLKDLLDMADAGESFEDKRNRVRLAPTTAQITRMDQALRWPFEHLADQPDLARALSLRAMWAAMRVDIRKRCEQRHINHEYFQLEWQRGLKTVTERLIARKLPVT
ncbi:hypothetical protein H8A95_15815 [Bradyrhizobium sp. Pear76]|uniref:hypothetical protein n=1 Tax=Bradyrhizobium oropedii TaxID=1571201 RepID=UPI001E51E1E6|nr:hypothetical protein [Bradyrhizobium oropedii]MCC8963737.1 hypothetical protein [Bradyrhizobium oropedii]